MAMTRYEALIPTISNAKSGKIYTLAYQINNSEKYTQLAINITARPDGITSYDLWLDYGKLLEINTWQKKGFSISSEFNNTSGKIALFYQAKDKEDALNFIACL